MKTRLRLAREAKFDTQQALADAAKVAQPTVALYEAGYRPATTTATLEKLADALDLELWQVTGIEDDRAPWQLGGDRQPAMAGLGDSR